MNNIIEQARNNTLTVGSDTSNDYWAFANNNQPETTQLQQSVQKDWLLKQISDGYTKMSTSMANVFWKWLRYFTDPLTEWLATISNLTWLTDLVSWDKYGTSLKSQRLWGTTAQAIKAAQWETQQFAGQQAYNLLESWVLWIAGSAGEIAKTAGAGTKVVKAVDIAGKAIRTAKTVQDYSTDITSLTEAIKKDDKVGIATSALSLAQDVYGTGVDIKQGISNKVNKNTIKEMSKETIPSRKNLEYQKAEQKLTTAIQPKSAVEWAEKSIKYNKNNINSLQDTIIKYSDKNVATSTPEETALKNSVQDLIESAKNKDAKLGAKLSTVVDNKVKLVDATISKELQNSKKVYDISEFDDIIKQVSKETTKWKTTTKKYASELLTDNIKNILEDKYTGKNKLTAKDLWEISQLAYQKDNTEDANIMRDFSTALKETIYKSDDALKARAGELFGLIKTSAKDLNASKSTSSYYKKLATENAGILDVKNLSSYQKLVGQVEQYLSGGKQYKALRRGILGTLKSSSKNILKDKDLKSAISTVAKSTSIK